MHWLSIVGVILVVSGLICSILGGELKARKMASPDQGRIDAVVEEVEDLRSDHKQLVEQSQQLIDENQRLKSDNGSLAIKNSQLTDQLEKYKSLLADAPTSETADNDDDFDTADEILYEEDIIAPPPPAQTKKQPQPDKFTAPEDYPDEETERESVEHMKTLLAAKDYDELQSFANGLLQAYSNWMAPYLYRGTAYRNTGDKQAALNDFVYVVENGTGDPSYEKAERALKLMTSRIQEMLDERQWKGLISACQASLSREPDWGLPYYYLGLAYSHIGEKNKAIESLKGFLSLMPNDPEAPRAERALRLLNSNIIDMQKQGDYMGLIRACEQEIQNDPNWMTPYYMLGLSYGNLGNRKKAIENLEMFVNKAPDDPDYENAVKVLNHLRGK